MSITLGEAIATHGIEVDDHLDRSFEIPVISGRAQRQGDTIILPMRPGKVDGLKPIAAEGVVVVRGESGGNTHTLIGTGRFAANTTDRTICGTLVVEKGDAVFQAHPEHGYLGIGEGSYIVRRQVEQAETLRLVAD